MNNVKKNTQRSRTLITVCLIIATLLSVFVFSLSSMAADPQIEGDHIVVDGTPYSITDINTLVDADLALLRYRSAGSTAPVYGTLDDEYLEGFEDVYNKVYDMLLDGATSTKANGEAFYSSTVTSTVVVKLTSGAITTIGDTSRVINGGGRLIVVAEDNATMNMTTAAAKFSIGNSSGKGTLVVQGRDQDNIITLKSSVEKTANAITVTNGSLYLQYCDLNGFKFTDKSLILLPSGNYTRFLYMSDSSMRNVTGTTSESSGIMCQVYSTSSSTNRAKDSKLFINNSLFDTCKVLNNNKGSTRGGAVIRSYAADQSELLVQNSTFNNNHTGHSTSNGTSSGGGAIYWKSVSGRAILKNCSFTNNHSTTVGGAILNMGTMEIIGCHFERNTAEQNGGAIAVETPYTSKAYTTIPDVNELSGTLKLDSETKIINNSVNGLGGGIYFNAWASRIGDPKEEGAREIEHYQMTLEINGAEIRGNSAGVDGGAIAIYLNYKDREYETGVTINEGSIIANNTAAQSGGAIWINSAADCDCKENLGVVMNGGTLDNNTATNGGAIYINAGKPDTQMNYYINGGTVTNNSATASGGAAYINSGSVIMSAGDVEYCTAAQDGGSVYVGNGSFSMSGGTVAHSSAERNGGAVYVDAGDAAVSGGKITDCSALDCGGAIYMRSGSVTLSDEALLQQCFAKNGGGAYLGGGNMTVLGGSIYKNTAEQDGGGAYLAGGSFTVENGVISENKAINGAGALVANGDVTVTGGVISQNEAEENGGAFSITNGNYKMTGGMVTRNKAINGDGGAIYVSSSQDNTNIVIRSGSLTENSAGKSGGALGVHGNDGVTFTITIGSHTYHYDAANEHVCADGGDARESCPVIKNNTSVTSGGGIYLSGSFDAVMNMYCLVEEGNKVGDGVSPSNFMKVEGGTLNIDTLGEDDQDNCGNIVVNSSIHVTGGKVTITGSVSNPIFKQPVTVDVDTRQDANFDDKREGGDARTIQYFENFEKQGGVSGQYTLIDFLATEDHVVRANMYTNVGYEVDGWMLMTMENGVLVPTGDIYKAGTTVTIDGDLIFYAKWVVAGYTVVFTPGVDSYRGDMEPQDFAYSDSKSLTPNAFINVGYIFTHWVDASDPTKIYTDAQIVSGLSNVHGTKITLVAVWTICNHNGKEYTLEASGGTATRQCSGLGYTETVRLVGTTVVYDKSAHGAQPTYERTTLNGLTPDELWSFTVLYSGSSFGDETLNGTDAPINAGNYTASIQIDGEHSISVKITIKKADNEPPAPPKYTTRKEDENTNVIVIEDPNDTTGFTLLYQFSWYEGKVLNHSDWMAWDAENPPHQELEVIYTNYYVDVKYAETPNYNESAVVRGNTVIVYTGKVTFNISSDQGILREEVVP